MNQTPRLVNRILLILIGFLLLLCGAHLMLTAFAADYAQRWQVIASGAGAWFGNLLTINTLPGQKDSWVWILIAAFLICIILLMLWWITVQGRGRGGDYVSKYFADENTPGRVEISPNAVDQMLRHFLGRRSDIISINICVWNLLPEAGLRVKVQPRKGTAPGPLGRDVARAARLAQDALGVSGPVLVYVVVGTRSRFARTERVI